MHPHLLVRLYLGWHACAAFYFGGELLLAPVRLISGPATVTIYRMASPRLWGLMFLVLALICAGGSYRPRTLWRQSIIVLGTTQTAWALGLFTPLFFGGRTNLLASAPWIALAVSSLLVAHYTHLQEIHPRSRDR
jgi:hypothetical protein